MPDAPELPPAPKKGRRRRRRKREKPAKAQEDVDRIDVDRTPTWVYYTILFVSVIGFLVGFAFFNSTSIGAAWKLGFTIELILFGITMLVVATRLARRQDWAGGVRRAIAGLFIGIYHVGQDIKQSVVNAVRGVAQSGTNLAGGLAGQEGEPNIVVKSIQRVVRLVVRIITFVVKVILLVIRLVLGIWALVVRLGWLLYNGIVYPLLLVAFRLGRWALRVVWRVTRWALKVAWRIVYFVLRSWPICYVTNWLREPVQGYAQPRLLLANVVISDLLLAPVREETREQAEPHVVAYRYEQDVKRAMRLLEKEEEHEALRSEYQRVMTPEERKQRRLQRKQEKARAKQEAKDAERRAKEEAKEERQRLKEEIKQAKAEGRDPKAEMKARKAVSKAAAKAAKKEGLDPDRARELAAERFDPEGDDDEEAVVRSVMATLQAEAGEDPPQAVDTDGGEAARGGSKERPEQDEAAAPSGPSDAGTEQADAAADDTADDATPDHATDGTDDEDEDLSQLPKKERKRRLKERKQRQKEEAKAAKKAAKQAAKEEKEAAKKEKKDAKKAAKEGQEEKDGATDGAEEKDALSAASDDAETPPATPSS